MWGKVLSTIGPIWFSDLVPVRDALPRRNRFQLCACPVDHAIAEEPEFRAAVTSSSGVVCVTYHERRRCGLAGIGLVAAGRAVAAARVGDAAIGVQREGSEAGGQEAEAEEGGERQCEKAFHGRLVRLGWDSRRAPAHAEEKKPVGSPENS